eukprot:1161598-Pelagomonas_calceolata.AAC.5
MGFDLQPGSLAARWVGSDQDCIRAAGLASGLNRNRGFEEIGSLKEKAYWVSGPFEANHMFWVVKGACAKGKGKRKSYASGSHLMRCIKQGPTPTWGVHNASSLGILSSLMLGLPITLAGPR